MVHVFEKKEAFHFDQLLLKNRQNVKREGGNEIESLLQKLRMIG